MGRPPLPRRLATLALLWGLCLCAVVASGCKRQPPNIYLITVDTLRPDHLGAWGYAKARTPTLDALAARGFVATDAVTPFPRTSPAMTTLMTGLRPEKHGSREVGQRPDWGILLADLLRSQGYDTVGVNSNAACGRSINLHHGFNQFTDVDGLANPDAADVTTAALGALTKADAKPPLFLWAHYVDPHNPYGPPGTSMEDPCMQLHARLYQEEAFGEIYTNREGVSAKALSACVAQYDKEITYADAEIARLLEGLKARGNLEDAIIIVTSDHGEDLGEWGLYYEHGPTVSDASARVPMIIAGPDIGPARYDGVFRLQDVMPTLLGLIGVDKEVWPVMNGVDLSATLKGGTTPNAPSLALIESGSPLHTDMFTFPISGEAFGRHCWNDGPLSLCAPPTAEPELYNHDLDPKLRHKLNGAQPEDHARLMKLSQHWKPERARQQAARTSRFKLVARPQLTGGYAYALYDLKADPKEQTDVSAAHPEEVERLKKELGGWRAGLPAIQPMVRSKEQMDMLKALGYVQ